MFQICQHTLNFQPTYHDLATKDSRFENWVIYIGVSHEIPSLTDVTPYEICSTFSVDPIIGIPSVILKIKHTWTARKADVETWFPVMKGEYIKHPPPPKHHHQNGKEQYRRPIQSWNSSARRDGHHLQCSGWQFLRDGDGQPCSSGRMCYVRQLKWLSEED
jgi:hypothetical protein